MTEKKSALQKFFASGSAVFGVVGVAVLALPAIFAPFIANGRPLLVVRESRVSLPFLIHFFAPDSAETFVEKCFNYLALVLPVACLLVVAFRRRPRSRNRLLAFVALAALLPFLFVGPRMDKLDYRAQAAERGGFTLFAPIPYGPFEPAGTPYAPPGNGHLLGCDEIGRDVASRLIYGARTSLAVGIFSTAIALVIGAAVGIAAGYRRGVFDLTVMRLVEILMCFPTFLLLLILMSSLGDRDFGQSIPIVIAVLGLTGWIGIAFTIIAIIP